MLFPIAAGWSSPAAWEVSRASSWSGSSGGSRVMTSVSGSGAAVWAEERVRQEANRVGVCVRVQAGESRGRRVGTSGEVLDSVTAQGKRRSDCFMLCTYKIKNLGKKERKERKEKGNYIQHCAVQCLGVVA